MEQEIRYSRRLVQHLRAGAEMVVGRYKTSGTTPETQAASGYVTTWLRLAGTSEEVAVATTVFLAWCRGRVPGMNSTTPLNHTGALYANPPLMVAGLMSECANEINKIVDLATTVRTAAGILKTEGWVQGSVVSLNGHDLLGALDLAINRDSRRSQADAILLWEAVLAEVRVAVGTSALAAWNDAPGRTAREVIATLNACADRLEIVQLT